MGSRRRRVAWTIPALRALEQAADFLAQDSALAAVRLIDQALERANTLASMPERGRIVPELRDTAVRELLVGPYRLLYRVTPDEVKILAFLHGARDFGRWRRSRR